MYLHVNYLIKNDTHSMEVSIHEMVVSFWFQYFMNYYGNDVNTSKLCILVLDHVEFVWWTKVVGVCDKVD